MNKLSLFNLIAFALIAISIGCSEKEDSTSSSSYYMRAGYCYDYNSGQRVDRNYCSQQQQYTNSCVGTYYMHQNNNRVPVTCDGTNCRGLTLYHSNGQMIQCQ